VEMKFIGVLTQAPGVEADWQLGQPIESSCSIRVGFPYRTCNFVLTGRVTRYLASRRQVRRNQMPIGP
jgi:hypothetical protein